MFGGKKEKVTLDNTKMSSNRGNNIVSRLLCKYLFLCEILNNVNNFSC